MKNLNYFLSKDNILDIFSLNKTLTPQLLDAIKEAEYKFGEYFIAYKVNEPTNSNKLR